MLSAKEERGREGEEKRVELGNWVDTNSKKWGRVPLRFSRQEEVSYQRNNLREEEEKERDAKRKRGHPQV